MWWFWRNDFWCMENMRQMRCFSCYILWGHMFSMKFLNMRTFKFLFFVNIKYHYGISAMGYECDDFEETIFGAMKIYVCCCFFQMRCFLHILLVITDSFFTLIRFSLTDHLFYNNLWLDYQQPLNTKSMILLPLFMGWYSVKRNLYICMENLFNVYKNCLVS